MRHLQLAIIAELSCAVMLLAAFAAGARAQGEPAPAPRARWLLRRTELLLVPAGSAARPGPAASALLKGILLDPAARPPHAPRDPQRARAEALERGLDCTEAARGVPRETARLLALAPPGAGWLVPAAALPERFERSTLAAAVAAGRVEAGVALSDRFHPWLLARQSGRQPLLVSIPSGSVLEYARDRWRLRPLDPRSSTERDALAALAVLAQFEAQPSPAWLRLSQTLEEGERAETASWFLWLASGRASPAALRLRTLQSLPRGSSLSLAAERLVLQQLALEDFRGRWLARRQALARAPRRR